LNAKEVFKIAFLPTDFFSTSITPATLAQHRMVKHQSWIRTLILY